ncbi:MAG: Unknown protein [uncultured Sulfurovum sp.]|uniref:Uncharacterized protein n=1 Tax=uncultured Sulfurovum sp. TaxID=269237 RepID=A0A6S6U436_9BACT|nr:MAG: Unknown protein [uncultured Sulfurovum sp.]
MDVKGFCKFFLKNLVPCDSIHITSLSALLNRYSVSCPTIKACPVSLSTLITILSKVPSLS